MKLRNGQSLIEVLVAVAITVIVVAALAFLSTTGLRLSKITSRRAEASKLASSGVEAIRYVRDVCGFISLTSPPSQNPPVCFLIASEADAEICGVISVDNGCSGGTYTLEDNTYNRVIQVKQYGGTPIDTALEVESTVSWSDSTGNNDIKNITSRVVLSAQ